MGTFGEAKYEERETQREMNRRERMALTGFSSFVVMYRRKMGPNNNSTAHAERDVGAMRVYYMHMNGRTPGSGVGVDPMSRLRRVTRG